MDFQSLPSYVGKLVHRRHKAKIAGSVALSRSPTFPALAEFYLNCPCFILGSDKGETRHYGSQRHNGPERQGLAQ
jgi:hypothetical protein